MRHNPDRQASRVIDYRPEGVEGSDSIHRLVTAILFPSKAPAGVLAARFHQCWRIETVLDEPKTNLRYAQIVLHSNIPIWSAKSSTTR